MQTYQRLEREGRIHSWIFPGKDLPQDNEPFEYVDENTPGAKSDWDPKGHGTGSLSKVVGPNFGVSKAADVTIVRIPQARRGPSDSPPPADDPNEFFATFRYSIFTDALNRVHQDFLTKRAANNDFQAVASKHNRDSYSAFGALEPSVLYLI